MTALSDLSWPEGIKTVEAKNRQALGEALAGQVAQWLRDALADPDRAEVTLAVSGGSTPVPFFEALSCEVLEWHRVCIVLVDERWVPVGHEKSNTRLLREHLLQGAAVEARVIPMVTDDATPEAGQPHVEENLLMMPLPLDVVVLGMGTDGHTASLFPDTPGLENAMDPDSSRRCQAMVPPKQDVPRITLTRAVLANALHRILHITGEEKLSTLEQALENPDNELAMPIRAFLKCGLTLYWSP